MMTAALLPGPVGAGHWQHTTAVRNTRAITVSHPALNFPDLLIATVAERERVTILHYDSDYDLIAQTTGQPAHWVVPRGTVP